MLFIIISLYSNLDSIVYNHYDSKIEEMKITEISKTITINDLIDLSENDIKSIKQIKHVIDIQPKEMETSMLGTIKFYEISVDDWKNVNSVIKIFNKNGIRCSRNVSGGAYDILFNGYENIQLVLKATRFIIIIVFSLLLINCWKNILKNEEKNINILKIIGYRNSQINTIKLSIFIVISMIIFFISFIIAKICLTILI